jgi:hypothetical protein
MYFCLLLVATGLLTLVSIPFLHCGVPLSSFGSEFSPAPGVCRWTSLSSISMCSSSNFCLCHFTSSFVLMREAFSQSFKACFVFF